MKPINAKQLMVYLGVFFAPVVAFANGFERAPTSCGEVSGKFLGSANSAEFGASTKEVAERNAKSAAESAAKDAAVASANAKLQCPSGCVKVGTPRAEAKILSSQVTLSGGPDKDVPMLVAACMLLMTDLDYDQCLAQVNGLSDGNYFFAFASAVELVTVKQTCENR